jgi:hypothetical protein
MCQQVSIYFELQEDNVTYQSCELISATGSFNIAENREDSVTTDDWVAAKNPQVIIKCVSDTGESSEAIAARFPKAKIIFIRSDVLSSRSELLYSEIAIAKELYPDWYTDVELSTVSEELGVDKAIIAFK